MSELEMLSPRERQVYSRRMAGMKNAAIAAELETTSYNVATLFMLAKKRIKSGKVASGHVGRYQDPETAARQRAKMRELSRGKRCPRCQLRGEHECLRLSEFAEGRTEAGGATVKFNTAGGHIVTAHDRP